MPGERAGAGDEPLVACLQTLEAFDKAFPASEHDSL